MMVLLSLVFLICGASYSLADPPPGKLDKLSPTERSIRVDQWETAIEQMPDAEKPGRRQNLRDGTGLSDDELEAYRGKVKKIKKPH